MTITIITTRLFFRGGGPLINLFVPFTLMIIYWQFHQQPKGALRRQSSAERETESNAILDAVEAGDHAEVKAQRER